MTREEAIAKAAQLQASNPAARFFARRAVDGSWAVGRVAALARRSLGTSSPVRVPLAREADDRVLGV